jgi:hypothetical protein
MAVNLSPVGGVAAQFFTNTGAVLTGGKLYTYIAGTTTPQATFTTSAGNVARTNPIVLDAAGRVPGSGEIWITQDVVYKFVLTDANDVLIATYDNISSISSLTLPIDSSNVTYDPPFAGSVATNVEAKLAQTVSVMDFGAVGNGVANDTAAVVAALAASDAVFFPAGTYLVNGNINIKDKSLYGVPTNSTADTSVSIIRLSGTNTNTSLFINGGDINTAWGSGGGCLLQNLTLRGNWDGSTSNAETNISNIGALLKWWSGTYVKVQNCYVVSSFGFAIFSYKLGYSNFQNSFISTNAKNGIHLEAPSGDLAITSTTINDCSVNSCRGTAPTGGSGVYIKNGFYCDLNGNVIEDVLVGIYIAGNDNRSITLFQNHMETMSDGGVRYVGAGTDLCLFANIFASAPYFVQTNAEFQDYKAIGNYNLEDQYTLPIVRAFGQQVNLTNAAPVATINQVTITPGTWLITASWIGTRASGTGQMSTRQQFALNNSAAFPTYPATPVTYEYATVRGDVASTVDTADGFMNGTLSLIVNTTTSQTIYLYGGPTSITSTLVVSCTGYIFATKVNGNYIS